MNDIIEEKININQENASVILTKIGLKNIERNFGGLSIEILDKLKQIFFEQFPQHKLDNEIYTYKFIVDGE